MFTHQCSVAKRGGCFQRRLFVCLFDVCLFGRTITSERLNIVRQLGALYKNLARVRMSRSKAKGQGHRGQKRKTAEDPH